MVARRNVLWSFALVTAILAGLTGVGCSGAGLTATEKSALTDPTIVAVFNDQALTLEEFEKRYARTVGSAEAARDDSLSEYQDYLDRFVNFKLKVLAADSAGYTRDPSILTEIDNYRTSFARPYLIDKEVMNPILSELYVRGKEMIESSHILLRVAENAQPADTLAAYQKLEAIRDSVMQGVEFGDLALRHSQDPSAQNPRATQGYRGWLGTFSAGRMVKPFEDQAYGTPVGEVSTIFRTQFGYHLLYVHDRQPKIDDIRISHIMVRPKGNTADDSTQALDRIQGLKSRIEDGEKFETVAREFSEERNSARNGGDLGFLRYDNYNVDPTFREAAFAMTELNTLSDIVTSQYGYHLLIITERGETGTFEEEYEALKRTASRLPRLRKAEVGLAKDARSRYEATIDTSALRMIAGPPLPPDSLLRYLRTNEPSDTLSSIAVATTSSPYSFKSASMRLLPRSSALICPLRSP